MKVLIKILTFLNLLVLIESKYEIILDRIETALPESENKIGAPHSLRVRKFNRSTSVINGIWELKIPLDDSVILSFEAFNFAGGQYKKIFGRTLGPYCQMVYEKHMEQEVRDWMAHTNLSISYGDCPYPPAFIQIKDWTPDGIGDYLPQYMPGSERWKVTTWLHKNDENLGGATIYGILRDTQKLIESKFG